MKGWESRWKTAAPVKTWYFYLAIYRPSSENMSLVLPLQAPQSSWSLECPGSEEHGPWRWNLGTYTKKGNIRHSATFREAFYSILWNGKKKVFNTLKIRLNSNQGHFLFARRDFFLEFQKVWLHQRCKNKWKWICLVNKIWWSDFL